MLYSLVRNDVKLRSFYFYLSLVDLTGLLFHMYEVIIIASLPFEIRCLTELQDVRIINFGYDWGFIKINGKAIKISGDYVNWPKAEQNEFFNKYLKKFLEED